jgi:hypothetical protein
MLPIVLNYLPHTLRKLCLESFHLVAIGLPVSASPVRVRQQRHSTTSYLVQSSPHQQQQQQLANGSSRLEKQQEDPQQQQQQAASQSEESSISSGISGHLSVLPLQQLVHLELEECCVDDAAMAAILAAATSLRTLELAGGRFGYAVGFVAAAVLVVASKACCDMICNPLRHHVSKRCVNC